MRRNRQIRRWLAHLLREAGEPLSTDELARAGHVDVDTARTQLHVLRRKGRVQCRRPRRWEIVESAR